MKNYPGRYTQKPTEYPLSNMILEHSKDIYLKQKTFYKSLTKNISSLFNTITKFELSQNFEGKKLTISYCSDDHNKPNSLLSDSTSMMFLYSLTCYSHVIVIYQIKYIVLFKKRYVVESQNKCLVGIVHLSTHSVCFN